MNARAIFYTSLTAGWLYWPTFAAAGELYVAPVRPAYVPTSPAVQDASAPTAARSIDEPLTTDADTEEVLSTLRFPVVTRASGMNAPRIEQKPFGWREAEAKAQAEKTKARKQAQLAAEQKKFQAKQRRARAARTAAQVRAGV